MLGGLYYSAVGHTTPAPWSWVGFAGFAITSDLPMYALSGMLTNPIPEPSTLVLLGVGFLGLVGYVYRRKRRFSD